MKLKSLLLGSAAALALSTGAQAADPIVEFVSLGVCDAYGITGLTIESDDTCLSISGEVEYNYEVGEDAAGFYTDSHVDWELVFEATTQTDAGAAVAHIRLREDGDGGVLYDRAYVQFGDTTVLTAGRAGSIFDTELRDREYGWLNYDELDNGYLNNTVATGGHVIQVEALVADGFTVLAALENLQGDSFDGVPGETGTAGLGIAFDNAGFSGEAGVLLGDIFGTADDVNYYARVVAEFDAFAVRAGLLADDTGDWIASLGASATFDMFSLDADIAFADGDSFNAGVEGSFSATDTVDVYIGVAYADAGTRANQILVGTDYTYLSSEAFTVYGGVEVDVTENISATAQLGYVDFTPGGDLVYGKAGVTYAPGGGFETGLDIYADTDDAYSVSFNASKEF